MLRFTSKVNASDLRGQASCYSTLTLTLDQRVRSRIRVTLANGVEAGLFLPRGTILRQHDELVAESGEVIRVLAAAEAVSTVYVNEPLLLARACYHLGNRHVELQISDSFIRYRHDHVLDDMVRGLGLEVIVEQAPFEPESGAYGDFPREHSHHHAH